MTPSAHRTLVASPSPVSLARAAALIALAATSLACRKDPDPIPDKPSSTPTASASTDKPATATSATAVPTPPTLVKEKFVAGGVHPDSVYAVEGALMVVHDFRVGRVVDDGIEWLAKTVPKEFPAFGPNRVDSVHGRWPDSIGVLYSNTNGRAPQPAYLPLSGVGIQYVVAEGGGGGNIYGVARIGDSTVVASHSMFAGVEFKTVRGTVARKPQTLEQAGCKEGEVTTREHVPAPPAVSPAVIGSTKDGTLLSIGNLCEKRPAAAEVWDKDGKSKIVDLGRWWKKVGWRPRLLQGSGDEMWAISDEWSRVLRYKNGEFEAVAELERPIQNLFVSTRGELHASDGRTIHRLDGKAWVPMAHLAEPGRSSEMVMDDKDVIWTSGVHRLRAGPAAPAPEPCSTWFVYLYETSWANDPKFTYPATRKGLATFPDLAAIGLVEYGEKYDRRLGITVTSKAQGEAVVAHLRQTMKDEDPRVFCFDTKKAVDVRTIEMAASATK